MIRGRRPGCARGAVLLAALLGATGCTMAVDGVPTAEAPAALPGSAEELEGLLVTDVPSGLPRVPDEELQPLAGPKHAEDLAAYAQDPEREREVLEEHGYRFGWERFWAAGPGHVTGVFVYRFENRAGAGAYAEDLARNEAEHYAADVDDQPPGLPGGCRLLEVDAPRDGTLTGPAAFAWCGHGVFSLGVTAVAPSADAAEDEVRAVLAEQLDRLPPG
ncbi:UNVERIFIED_ORG: hypothetical protein E4P37_13115 [Bacillus sp. AZ43]